MSDSLQWPGPADPAGTSADPLLPGERVLWSGRPGRVPVPRRRVVRKALWLVYDLAVFFLALAVVLQFRFEDAFARRGGPLFWLVMALALVALVLPTLGDVVRMTLVRSAQLRGAWYQVSNLRVMVTSGRRPRYTWSVYLDQIEDAVTTHADGTADINLAGPVFLYGIREPDQVLQVITDARPRMLDDLAGVAPPAGAAEPPDLVLDAGEQVLWTGRPREVPWWFGSADIATSLRLACGVVAFGLVAGVVFAGVAVAQYTFGSLALLALYLAAGRVLVRRRRIRHSRYVLTDRRLVVSWRGRGKSVAQAPLSALRPPMIWGRSLLIETVPTRSPSVHYWRRLTWPAASNAAPCLIGIDDLASVRDLLCAAQLAQRASVAASGLGSAHGAADAV